MNNKLLNVSREEYLYNKAISIAKKGNNSYGHVFNAQFPHTYPQL